MIAEKAMCAPGRSAEEVKEELKRKELSKLHFRLSMTNEEATRFCDSLDDAPYLYGQAASLFGLIQKGALAGWFDTDDPGITAACEFARIALNHKAETDGDAMTDLGMMLKAATTNPGKTFADQEDGQ